MSLYTYFEFNSTGSIHVYKWKEYLKTVGWIVSKSSDGTTYNASGDIINSGASGGAGLANSRAWMVLTSPSIDGYQRQLCIQKSTSGNLNWRIKYSFSAGFSGGSPSATQTPSATDEQILLGGGTDASPTFGTLLDTDANYRSLFIIGDANHNYVNYFLCISIGTDTDTYGWVMESFDDTYKINVDGERFTLGSGNNFTTTGAFGVTTAPFSWYKKNLVGESFVRTPWTYPAATVSGTTSFNLLGSQEVSKKEILLPIITGRRSALGGNTGFRGILKYIKFSTVSRSSLTTITYNTNMDYIIIGNLAFPWNGSSI